MEWVRLEERSGLGPEAQRTAVREYLAGKGWPPAAEFVEIESGRKNDRPELARALEACRLYKATLVIAKLDRLKSEKSISEEEYTRLRARLIP